jgi:hypothetical protein
MKMMKTTFLLILGCFLVCIGSDVKAQSNWEIGARFGNYPFAIEATLPLGAAPRLHPSVYISDRFGVGAYFDWMFAISGGPTGLKFYPGVGPSLWFEGDFDFDISGDFGVEYSFKFPLTIGFDWRPAFRTTDSFKFRTGNWGFTARFRIAKGAKFERVD